MLESEIRAKLTVLFRDVFDDDTLQIRDDMTAKDVEEWDSLTHINLIVAAEGEFGVSFTTKEVQSLRNVGEFIALIAKKAA